MGDTLVQKRPQFGPRKPGEILGEELDEELDEIFSAFSCFMCCAERPTQIPPNLSLHVLSRFLWLKSQNFISASFWGFGAPNNGTKERNEGTFAKSALNDKPVSLLGN